MKSGYKIEWTDNALAELKATYQYIEDNWTERELRNLSIAIENTLKLISDNPKIFPVSERKRIRKVVVRKWNTLYYVEQKNNRVEILSFFSNRQKPNKRRI